MKNLRKCFAVFVAAVLLATAIAPAFAADAAAVLMADSKACEILGMLKGEGGVITNAYVKSSVTRLQAAIMFLRLRGLEAEALAFAGNENFADADEVEWEGGKAILGYLKANKDLGWQGDGTNFNPAGIITAQEYYKILLVSLGYVEGKDFQYADTLKFAEYKGLKIATKAEPFVINNAAAATVEALKATRADGKATLLQFLIDTGVLDRAKAQAAGLVSAAVSQFSIYNEAKSLTVKFDAAPADAAKLAWTVTREGISVRFTFTQNGTDKTKFVYNSTTNLVTGEYKVAVKYGTQDLGSKSFKIEDEKLAGIEMLSDNINRRDDFTGIAYYKVTNQYGEDVTRNAIASSIVWNSSLGEGSVSADKGTLTFTKGMETDTAYMSRLKDFTATPVVVTAYDTDSGISFNESLTVSATVGDIQSIKLLGISNADGKTAVEKGASDIFYIDYEIKDSAGNLVTDYSILSNTSAFALSPKAPGESGIIYAQVVQDPADSKKAKFQLKNDSITNQIAGTQVISAIALTSGKSATLNIDVKEGSEMKEFVLQKPEKCIAQGDGFVEVSYIALDGNGEKITDHARITARDSSNARKLKFNMGADKIHETNNPDGSYTLRVDFGDMKSDVILTATVTSSTAVKMSSITVSVQAWAVPSSLARIDTNKFVPALVYGASVGDRAQYIAIYDQYDRRVDLRYRANKYSNRSNKDTDVPYYYYFVRGVIDRADLGKVNFGTADPAVLNGPDYIKSMDYHISKAVDTRDPSVGSAVYEKAVYGQTGKLLIYGGPYNGPTNVRFELVKASANSLWDVLEVVDSKIYTFYNVDKKDISEYYLDKMDTMFAANGNPADKITLYNVNDPDRPRVVNPYTYTNTILTPENYGVSVNAPDSGSYFTSSNWDAKNKSYNEPLGIWGKYNGMKVALGDMDIVSVTTNDKAKFDARTGYAPYWPKNSGEYDADRTVWAKYINENDQEGTVTVVIRGYNGVFHVASQTVRSSAKRPAAKSIAVGWNDPYLAGGSAENYDKTQPYIRPMRQEGNIYRIKNDYAKTRLTDKLILLHNPLYTYGYQSKRCTISFVESDQYGKSSMAPIFLVDSIKDDGSPSSVTAEVNQTKSSADYGKIRFIKQDGRYMTASDNFADGDTFSITAIAASGLTHTVKIVIDNSADPTVVY